MARYNSSGWHFQSTRHSNAKRTGHAGGTYANSTPRSREISENISRGILYSKLQKEYGYVPAEQIRADVLQRMNREQNEKNDFVNISKKDLDKEVKKSTKHFGSPETAGQVLERLSNSNQSSEQDSRIMQSVLRQSGFPNAVVVSGVVYLEGHGTMDAPPTSIHSMAKMLLSVVAEAKETKHYGKSKEDEMADHFYNEDWKWFKKEFGVEPRNSMEAEDIIQEAKLAKERDKETKHYGKKISYQTLTPSQAQRMIDESKGMSKAKWEKLWDIAQHPISIKAKEKIDRMAGITKTTKDSITFATEEQAKKYEKQMQSLHSPYTNINYGREGKTVIRW